MSWGCQKWAIHTLTWMECLSLVLFLCCFKQVIQCHSCHHLPETWTALINPLLANDLPFTSYKVFLWAVIELVILCTEQSGQRACFILPDVAWDFLTGAMNIFSYSKIMVSAPSSPPIFSHLLPEPLPFHLQESFLFLFKKNWQAN